MKPQKITFRCIEAEKDLIKKASIQLSITPSTFSRMVTIQKAREILNKKDSDA